MNPWEAFPHIWNTQSKYMAWVRGGIRKGLWNRHPVKLEFLKNNRKQIVNDNPRSMKRYPFVWGAECCVCNQTFNIKEIEVDHKQGNHSLRSMSDVQAFIEGIVAVMPDDLQLICKGCHKIKSYAEKQGISQEEAAAEKKAIELCKRSPAEVKEWLESHGVKPHSNAAKRRRQVAEVLKGKK